MKLSPRPFALLLAVCAALLCLPTMGAEARPGSAPYCGKVLFPKPTGGHWQCTWSDDFSVNTLNTDKWNVQETSTSAYHSGAECFVNNPNNVWVSNGSLKLAARKTTEPFTCNSPAGSYATQYTSGMVTTYGSFSQAYGRFEARIRIVGTKAAGLQSAFWLWPEDSLKYGAWPLSGEIDIAEFYSSYPDRAIPYVHYAADSIYSVKTNNYCVLGDLSAYHTYVAEWTASTITIKYDDKTCLAVAWSPLAPLLKPAPFDSPFIIALTQMLGIGANAFDPATTPLPATTEVDYVRVWR